MIAVDNAKIDKNIIKLMNTINFLFGYCLKDSKDKDKSLSLAIS